MALKISSLNINGLRKKFKQDIIFKRFNNLGFDIVFLQETHVTNMTEAMKFSKLWESRTFWSFGTTKSHGVGIVLNKNFSFKVISVARDTDGRLLCLDIDLAGSRYRLISVNMHNNPTNRSDFINDLEGYLITPRERHSIK